MSAGPCNWGQIENWGKVEGSGERNHPKVITRDGQVTG